jgi:4-hydroxybenzoate polyprenyltransferase
MSVHAPGDGATRSPHVVRALIRTARPEQWVKNLLLVVPAISAHRFDLATLEALAFSLLAFSLVASGNYILNDVLDMGADRLHPRKESRPIAAGHVSPGAAAFVMAVTWLVGFWLSATRLPVPFTLTIAAYLLVTTAYSLRLKREPVLDVLVLASLYVLRVVAGGAATNIRVSTWLLAFTLFVCLSIAFLKRFVEVHAFENGPARPVPGRGYVTSDASWLHSAGIASAYLSTVVLAIYTNSPDVSLLYRHPDRLLLLCPLLLYMATRVWMLAHRRRLHDDPVTVFALDPVTYGVGVLSAAVVWAAS